MAAATSGNASTSGFAPRASSFVLTCTCPAVKIHGVTFVHTRLKDLVAAAIFGITFHQEFNSPPRNTERSWLTSTGIGSMGASRCSFAFICIKYLLTRQIRPVTTTHFRSRNEWRAHTAARVPKTIQKLHATCPASRFWSIFLGWW